MIAAIEENWWILENVFKEVTYRGAGTGGAGGVIAPPTFASFDLKL